MVIRITRIVETSIQVVSPLLTVGVAAASPAVWATTGWLARSASAAPAKRVRKDIGKLRIEGVGERSERIAVGLPGADADGAFDRHHEDLPVADLAGASRRGDRFDDPWHQVRGHGDLDLQLGQETHRVFGAAIDLRM